MILLADSPNIARAIRRKLPFLPKCVDLDGSTTSSALYLGIPGHGTSAHFGVSQECVAWGYDFSEVHLNLLEAIITSEGLNSRIKLLSNLPDDWENLEL